MVRGGVTYACTCNPNNNHQPPDCRKEGLSGRAGFGGAHMGRFNPGQQVALMATQAMMQGLLNGIFSPPARNTAAEDALRAQQDRLRQQEEERQKALESWNIFRQEEAKRIEAEKVAARRSGDELLGRMGSSTGTALGFESFGGRGLEFKPLVSDKAAAKPTQGKALEPKSAVEQARCAAYFSDEALKLAKDGKHEEAEFMSRQVQKAMAGETTDVPCQGAAVLSPDPGQIADKTPAIDVNAVLEQYNAKIQDLFAISQRLAEVRKQKIDTQLDLRQANDRIAQIRPKAASVTKPEEKEEADDLLRQALALKEEAEERLKIAEENENTCLADAKKAEDAVKELDSTLKKDQGGK